MPDFIHALVFTAARRTPHAPALVHRQRRLDYAALAASVARAAGCFLGLGLARGARVAVYLEKSPEAVSAMFGAAAAGGVFVPVNPLLKPEQVVHILADCATSILVTSAQRLAVLAPYLAQCPALSAVVLTQGTADGSRATSAADTSLPASITVLPWPEVETGTDADAEIDATAFPPQAMVDTDVAAILYTSGSTGKPKGVVLSHRNLVVGATSVASYLGNTADDRLLAVLPLSFDYGLSQLTTAFHAGACVVLLEYLLPRDILKAVQAESITGLAAVPPLWRQIAALPWPADCSLRYLTNSGGSMPRDTLAQLQAALPHATPFLMYGLTEAFRSTYLPPAELARRPGSIGKAIPNAEVLVLRPDGSECATDEAGELVHRGPLVALGYWNDPAKSAERFRPLPPRDGLPFAELAVWSGDTVRRDADGFLYFISRADEMIKSSGYRVSPTEVEEVLYADARVIEAVALGVPHPALGQAIVVVACVRNDAETGTADADSLLASCRIHLPGFMLPARIIIHEGSLPRNPNGKIDRALLRAGLQDIFRESTQ